MPVVSQSRFSTTSSTSLSTGSYRSSINSSSSLDRPFYSTSSGSYVSPRSHRNAFSSEYRSQLSYDSDGLRERKCSYSSDYSSRYSRAPSISDSDSAISSDSRITRSERSGSRSRDTSVARSDSARSSYRSDSSQKSILNLNSSEFYKKYSPNSYVPLVQRTAIASSTSNGEVSRSKSLTADAARLPLPRRLASRTTTDDEVKSRTNTSSITSVKRHTNSTHVVKPCVQIECVTNPVRLTNDQVKRDIDCAQRQRGSRAGDVTSGSRTTSGLIPRAKAQSSWIDRKQTQLSNDLYDSTTDDNGNDLRLSVAEIRKKFDPSMTVRHSKEPMLLYKTAHSSDNIYSQVRSLNNSISSLHLDSKPVPVHKPTSIDKHVNNATGSLRWEFFSSKNSDSNDSKGSMFMRNSADSVKDVSTVYIPGNMNAERLPINAVKNQLNANNPINKVLEKATTVYVGNGDIINSKDKSNDIKNILNIEIGNENNSNVKSSYGRHGESVQDKVAKKHTSDFASYIQVSTPVCGNNSQTNGESYVNDENNDEVDCGKYCPSESPTKSISSLLSADEVDGSKLRYIDSEPNSESDNRLIIDYNVKDENNYEEQGFENKTFEHENGHLLRRPLDESNYSFIKPKQNGVVDSDISLKAKFKSDDADSGSSLSHAASSEVSSLRSKNFDEISSGDEEGTREEKHGVKGVEVLVESTGKINYNETNGEVSSAHHYHNDSGLSRGNSPLSGASTCGTLSSTSGSLPRKTSVQGVTSDKLSKTSGLNGLRNIGNTCFMNSVVQCLSNTRPLMEYCGNTEAFTSDINTTLSCMKGALIKAFSTVICELWREGESDSVVNTTSLKTQIQRFAPRFMGYSQQDAQEFLRYLLEGLHEDVNRVTVKPKPILTEIDDNLSDAQKAQESWNRYLRSEDSRVGDIFVGQLKSSLRCTHCNHISVTFDPFWDLSLPIPSRTGQLKLTQCLSHFTREEELDGDEKPTCSKCQVRRKCVKWFTIQKFPKVLVLHLKRFSPQERFRGKLNVLVEFPLQGLDLSPYSATAKHHEYNLYAVSNHSGTTYSGHYTAYCKHPYNGEWHEYNDSRVSPISPKNVVSSEAYVLFYELSNSSSSS